MSLEMDLSGKLEEYPIGFYVDSRDPRISRTMPRRNAFTNGSGFSVRYSEDNVREVILFWNPNVSKIDCPISKDIIKAFSFIK